MLDLIIIGAGPAGLSACLYASRAGLDVLIFDSAAPGGKLNVTAQIENYPGLKATPGPEIAFTMYESALSFGAKMEYGEVLDIKDYGDNKVKGLVLENSETGEKEELMVNGIFLFIGLDPMTQCAKSLGIVNSAGYIDANENMETAVKGIFVAGDVRNKQLRQVVTATNDGAIAGQYIASLK